VNFGSGAGNTTRSSRNQSSRARAAKGHQQEHEQTRQSHAARGRYQSGAETIVALSTADIFSGNFEAREDAVSARRFRPRTDSGRARRATVASGSCSCWWSFAARSRPDWLREERVVFPALDECPRRARRDHEFAVKERLSIHPRRGGFCSRAA